VLTQHAGKRHLLSSKNANRRRRLGTAEARARDRRTRSRHVCRSPTELSEFLTVYFHARHQRSRFPQTS
jgi:hypothetical protein